MKSLNAPFIEPEKLVSELEGLLSQEACWCFYLMSAGERVSQKSLRLMQKMTSIQHSMIYGSSAISMATFWACLVLPHHILYVGSGRFFGKDNALYAIQTKSFGLANSPWPMRGQNARHTGREMNP